MFRVGNAASSPCHRLSSRTSSVLRRPAAIVLMSLVGVAVGCSDAGKPGTSGGKPPAWELALSVDGADVRMPLEVLDVHLFDDDDMAETFELRGPGVVLVGEMPKGVHVGYAEKWEALIGRPVMLSDKPGGQPRRPKAPVLTLPGKPPVPVVGGQFTVESCSGSRAGSEGDLTVAGTITIRIRTAEGERTLTGRFAAKSVTWG